MTSSPRTPTPDINAILKASPRSCKYGAPLGARSYCDGPSSARLYCQRIRMVDGDYAPDGTYWGGGWATQGLWCAFRADGTARVYVRAWTRSDALRQALAQFPELAAQVEAGQRYQVHLPPTVADKPRSVGQVTIGDWTGNMDAARNLMDDDLAELVHGTVDTDQEFVNVYCALHRAKYGDDFRVN